MTTVPLAALGASGLELPELLVLPPLLPHAARTRLVRTARPPATVPRSRMPRVWGATAANREVGDIGVSLLLR